MKKLLMIVLLSALGMAEEAKKDKYVEVCKSYIEQAKEFQKTMGSDAISKERFTFYKDKVVIHCGNLTSKAKFERKSFSDLMMKNDVTDKKACRMAIDMASKYSKENTQSKLMIAAYKENISDKCGALMAAHISNYCLYEEIR